MSGSGVDVFSLRTPSATASTYRSNSPGRCARSASISSPVIQVSTKGRHPMSVSLMKRMPARDTVAGVALEREFTSNTMRMAGESGMRSLDTSVSILLSSITVCMRVCE